MAVVPAGLSATGVVATAATDHQEDHAEIRFNPQRTTGASVRVARYLPRADGFITIHTWDLIEEQDGPGTICGVSELIEPGDYANLTVNLFDEGTGYSSEFGDQERLYQSQRLVAVPHRDVEHTGTFEFAGEHHTDIPFRHGTRTRDDLPANDGEVVNDWAYVRVVEDQRDRRVR